MSNKQDIIPNPQEMFDWKDNEDVCFLCSNPSYVDDTIATHFEIDLKYKKCTNCGIVKQLPMPNEKYFDWFFNSPIFFSSKKTNKKYIWGYHDFFADEADRMATSKRRYKKLKKLIGLTSTKKIVKIGPATGTFLYVSKEDGHDVIGSDISEKFASYAKSNYDIDIIQGRFEERFPSAQEFDLLMLLNVVENVPNQDDFLRHINKVLKPGAHFVLNYVDMQSNLMRKIQGSKYFIYRPPITYIYDRKSIRTMLNKYGFEVSNEYRDIRNMNVEKILTLLNLNWVLKIARALRLSQISFPLYAYPSKIIVAKKISNL